MHSSYCGKRQGSDARSAPLFTTPRTSKTSTNLEKTPICIFYERATSVQHGLNLNPGTFAAISTIKHCTPSPRRHHHHHGAPAIATRELAPIRAQATLETASTVGRWKDAGRDEPKRSQCAKCTRRAYAAADVYD
jgi:hypothetical protein